MYLERKEEERQKFIKEISLIAAKDIVYIDESGIDESIYRTYGRARKGKKIIGEVFGKKKQRVSIIAALNQKRLKATFRFDGYTDTIVFNHWVENCLVPALTPGQTVIMDNASFHKSAKTKELIENAGCFLKFLPVYSPDLNPIENQWAILKARIIKVKNDFDAFLPAIDYVLINCKC